MKRSIPQNVRRCLFIGNQLSSNVTKYFVVVRDERSANYLKEYKLHVWSAGLVEHKQSTFTFIDNGNSVAMAMKTYIYSFDI